MKSRSSNRVTTSDPPDDWVNGSWTVDCICGVTFDDGEEMVNCDECGVWVHTRCFRFAKGAKSFACDKCKNKGVGNDSEETEVAQLLVELPTKTIKMSTSNHGGYFNSNVGNRNSNSNSNVFAYGGHSPAPRRSPYRMWAKPMEERVHVQGVPGGGDDSGLFKGFPIAFASELWKCSGYVPKKFNFKYREFPCWDDEVGVGAEANGADVGGEKGAGVLCSLSKENVVVGVEGSEARSGGGGGGGGLERKGLKDRKTSSGDLKKSSMVSLSKKEKGVCRSILVKRSREELGSSKDRSGKKKMKASPREEDSKKDRGHDFKTVIVQSISARQAEVYERKTHKAASNALAADISTVETTKTNSATDEGNLVLRSPEVSGHGGSSDKVKAEKPADDAVDCSQKSAVTQTLPLLNTEKDGVLNTPLKKEEIVSEAMDKSQVLILECQSSDISKSKTLTKDMDVAGERNEAGPVKDVETTVSVTCKTKSDTNVNNPKGGMSSRPDDINVELDSDEMKLCTEQVSSLGRDCEESKPNETVAASSHEGQDDGKTSEAPTGSQLVNDEGITENICNNKVECEGSENPVDVQRTSLGSKEASKVAGETSKLSEEMLPSSSSHHNKACAGKLSSSSSTIVNSRSSISDKNKAGTSQYPSSTGNRILTNSSMLIKKESSSRVQVKDGDSYEKTKSIVKDVSKSSSTMKTSQSSKTVTSPVLKHHSSLGKDSMRHPSSKKTSVELSSGNDELTGSKPTQQGSNGQNKSSTSAGQHRGEKTPQSNLQSSKSAQFGHPPPSSIAPAGLSDEELALLLHQELNSSPRVPRVPRVRHSGNLPQISSASATSIFIKHSNSFGGKEQQTFSRRKNKDGSRSSRDQDSEVRKFDRAPSSPDSVKTSDAEGRAEGPSESIHSVRKNAQDISTSAHSGPSSTDANELKSSSIRRSSNNNPEDNTGANKSNRTLPGLIAEIMGEGKRMTYEELCNAVLPHWQNLRKHNGERYAYSSHSQAVLDCLRNRSEWSRLVDRGPKTSAIRKKRKIDVDPPNTESEDGGYRTRRAGKSKSFESNKEEFPKGRRKARKRRRLALQGRGVRDDRKRTKVEVRSEDSASFSDSSEDTGTSEDDSQESGMGAAKSEVSASSADTATMR